MALTNELLAANAALSTLTDEQKAAIVEMSRNDEASVIGQKTGEIYGGLDADILTASGIAKNGTEKTYDYAKRVIGTIKEQASTATALQSKVADLEKENARLEGVVAKGGADAETRKQLEQAKADLANVTKEFTEIKAKYDNARAEHEKELFGMRLDGEFAKATAGLKFKADLPASVLPVLTEQAISRVKGMNPEFIDDGNGGKVLAFLENGAVKRNPENNLRPYTASELVAKELTAMGVLDTGRKMTGTGSNPNTTSPANPSSGGLVDISGARTQSEAHEIIAKQLLAQGKVNGSKDFADAMADAWRANKDIIKSLPIR